MLKKTKNPMTAEELYADWDALTKLEPKLKRNARVSRILQPVGLSICGLNLLLATVNVLQFIGGRLIEELFLKLPLLPSLVGGFPRGSVTSVTVFSLLFVLLLPMTICGGIYAISYFLEKNRGIPESRRLIGTELERAAALTNQAERMYLLRKRTKLWQTSWIAGILTGVLVIPVLTACLRIAASATPAVLELTLGLLILLLCLFVVFWIYVGVLKGFSLLLSLFFLGPGEWKLYLAYRRADAYLESLSAPQKEAAHDQD